MTKSYGEIMENIKLSAEARERILQNVASASTGKHSGKMVSFSKRKRVTLAAACAVVLVAGVGVLPVAMDKLSAGPQDQAETAVQEDMADAGSSAQEDPGFSQAVWTYEEYDSLKELSQAVGFGVEGLAQEPLKVTSVKYAQYGTGMAQVTYTGKGNEATYRKSKTETAEAGQNGQTSSEDAVPMVDTSATEPDEEQADAGDNSGIYSDFAVKRQVSVQFGGEELTLTLKGDKSDSYKLVYWQQGGYDYSVYFEKGVSKQEILAALGAA